MADKILFEELLTAVPQENQDFVQKLHDQLTELGCKIEIKLAKSGYMVSYTLNKKTVANYVFRKKGMLVRIYGNHVNQYPQVLEALPEELVHAIQKAPVCKRMVNPDSCNPKCAMGYDFWLKGEHQEKCRYSAFMFLLCPQNNPHIQSFLLNEVKAYQLNDAKSSGE